MTRPRRGPGVCWFSLLFRFPDIFFFGPVFRESSYVVAAFYCAANIMSLIVRLVHILSA